MKLKNSVMFLLVASSAQMSAAKNVDEIMTQLSLPEKIKMLAGDGAFSRPAILAPDGSVKVPALNMTDGPMGIANATLVEGPKATAFPATIALAASWNPNLASEVSSAIATEAKAMGKNMLLAPCVNIQRAPQGGRNFESFSEDPYLSSQMTAHYVTGVQSQGVIATVKHFALNNQETDRLVLDVHADPEVMKEIYFPSFKAAVDAGVGAIMSSYNKVNGVYASQNSFLLDETLKGWGFQGIVISDWGATYKSNTLQAFNAGLNIEMPWPFIFTPDDINTALEANLITEKSIDEKIERQLQVMKRIGILDSPENTSTEIPLSLLEEHRDVAYRAALEGSVLLKNEKHFLPLNSKLKSLVVLGPNATPIPHSGAGSGKVNPWITVDAMEGISKVISPTTKLSYVDETQVDTSSALIRNASVVVFFLGLSDKLEGEGQDRSTLSIPQTQIDLLEKVSTLNKNIVVFLNSGGMLTVGPWISHVKALFQLWYPGQEAGRAAAAMLFGKENPSGKLPISFLKREEDSWAFGNFPGSQQIVTYAEGSDVGYRYLDKNNIAPRFPFGYGLSYTDFEYRSHATFNEERDLSLKITIRNTGKRAGAEVLQLYARLPGHAKKLVAFQKVFLKARQSKRIILKVSDAEANEYWLGNSSRNLKIYITH